MRLGFEKIKEITKGAVRILNDNKYIRYHYLHKKE